MLHAILFALAVLAQPQTNSPLSAKADHLALHVADLDRSVTFYTRYFGLHPIPATARIGTMRWLQAGAFEVHLIGGRTDPVTVPIALHFALRVQDLSSVIAKLDADKVPWSDSNKKPRVTQTRLDGVRQLYLQDPDGYWIEVNELPKPAN